MGTSVAEAANAANPQRVLGRTGRRPIFCAAGSGWFGLVKCPARVAKLSRVACLLVFPRPLDAWGRVHAATPSQFGVGGLHVFAKTACASLEAEMIAKNVVVL